MSRRSSDIACAPAPLEKRMDDGYQAVPEQAIVFEIDAWDVNCPQHIRLRYTEDQIAQAVESFQKRIADLEAKLAAGLND